MDDKKGGDDYIDRIIKFTPGKSEKQPKYKLTIEIEHQVWMDSKPYLHGKYGALLEGAILAYLERVRHQKQD